MAEPEWWHHTPVTKPQGWTLHVPDDEYLADLGPIGDFARWPLIDYWAERFKDCDDAFNFVLFERAVLMQDPIAIEAVTYVVRHNPRYAQYLPVIDQLNDKK